MDKLDIASLRTQARAKIVAEAMQVIGLQNERQAEWLADLMAKHFDKLLQPVENVIQVDANPDPAAIIAQINDFSGDLARTAFIAMIDVMMAALTLGLKVGQAQ